MKGIPEEILLEMATTTPNKKKILLSLSKKSYFIRELAKKIGITPRAVQWELKKFEEFDLVKFVTDGKRKFYALTNNDKKITLKIQSH